MSRLRGSQPASSTTDHNGESTKSTPLPSRCVLNRADVADWALVAPCAENGTVSKISNQIIFSQCVVGFCGSCWKLFFDLGCVEKQLEWRALRCISGLVHTGKSDDDKDLDWILLIAARATSAELESSVHLHTGTTTHQNRTCGGFPHAGTPRSSLGPFPHPRTNQNKGPGIWVFLILCPGSAGADAQDPKTGQ